jgi:gluconate 5-dehydrogenase
MARRAQYFEEATAALPGAPAVSRQRRQQRGRDPRSRGNDRKTGPPTILVNAAGISWGAPAIDMSLEKMQEVLMVNVVGAFLCAQAVASGMRAAGWGKIVNVGIGRRPGRDTDRRARCRGLQRQQGRTHRPDPDLAAKWGDRGASASTRSRWLLSDPA